jgi:hypothetical protein
MRVDNMRLTAAATASAGAQDGIRRRWFISARRTIGGHWQAARDESRPHDAPTSAKLVELEEIPGALRDHGPLSSDALARELSLYSFDLRLALVNAATWGLVNRDGRGAWTLTDRGTALVTPVLPVADRADSSDHGRRNRG